MTALRVRWWSLVTVAALVLVTSCSVGWHPDFGAIEHSLRSRGYVDARIDYVRDQRGDVLVLSYDAGPDGRLERRRAEDAARIVWQELVVAFDELELRPLGSPYARGDIGYSYEGLGALFGGRGEASVPSLTIGISDRFENGLKSAGRATLVAAVLGMTAFIVGSALWLRRPGRPRTDES